MSRADTKEKLINATLWLISEKGYLGATTREISRRAGVTELTLFRHFGSKEKLFEEMLKQHTFLPRLKELKPTLETMDPGDALKMVGIQFLETLKERKSLVKIVLSELNSYPEKVRKVHTTFVDEMVRILAEYLEKLQQEKKLRIFPPEDGARIFFRGIFSHFLSEEIFRGKDLNKRAMERNISLYVDIFINGTAQKSDGGATNDMVRRV
jgi:AcrR family transcriptional regulator